MSQTDPLLRHSERGGFVPLSIRSRSRVVSWLWLRTNIGYDRARGLARRLP